MALIKCTECSAEISEDAPACPKCGKPTNKAVTPSAKKHGWLTKLAVVIGTLAAVYYFGFGVSESEMKNGIQSSLQQKLDTDANFSKYKMKVLDVALVKKTSNSFDGLAKVSFMGTEQQVPLQVTVDGSNYMYQAPPLAFAFVAQYELQKLGR